jgi:hypothetical protein
MTFGVENINYTFIDGDNEFSFGGLLYNRDQVHCAHVKIPVVYLVAM